MPRLARLDAPGILHQVMGRGIERKKIFNFSLGELRSGGRRRNVVEARCSMSWIAVRELGYSGADVARYLGVTNSCVTRLVASGKKHDFDVMIL